jgi:restriction endonuclease Mrr
MPVPDYQTLMRPVLVWTAGGEEHTAASIRDAIIDQFELTPEDIESGSRVVAPQLCAIVLGGRSRACTARGFVIGLESSAGKLACRSLV